MPSKRVGKIAVFRFTNTWNHLDKSFFKNPPDHCFNAYLSNPEIERKINAVSGWIKFSQSWIISFFLTPRQHSIYTDWEKLDLYFNRSVEHQLRESVSMINKQTSLSALLMWSQVERNYKGLFITYKLSAIYQNPSSYILFIIVTDFIAN